MTTLTFSNAQQQKAFLDLQDRLIEATQQYQQLSAAISINEREKQKGILTIEELGTLPTNARSYQTLGRTFIEQPLSSLKEELSRRVKLCEKEIEKQKNRLQALEKKIKEYDSSLQKLLPQK
eukprot:TRINITY_DN1379_c0_g1_i1.p1 TRINITY_DN1379_c0_g1~~TRINITY_DN1379_c0_g1_i1.p1  ORF type:complete len:122 (-),score=21.15 TRINITY_DN1379_c0_g1_i1:59-424(-)